MPPLFPRRGEIYMGRMRARSPEHKRRPLIIISPDDRNRWASNVLVIPASTHLKPSPTHVFLDRDEGGLPHTSVAKCEQITTLEKSLLDAHPLGGALSEGRIGQLEKACLTALGIFPE